MLLADLFDSFLIDLDGVVYVGDKPTFKAAQITTRLIKAGKELIYITNDPRRSSTGYAKKLSGIGIKTHIKNVVTSASAISMHIESKYTTDSKTAFVIGSDNLKNEVEKLSVEFY